MKTALSLVLVSLVCAACKRAEMTPPSGSRPLVLDPKAPDHDESETVVPAAKDPIDDSSKSALSAGKQGKKPAQDKPRKSEEAAAQNAVAKFHAALKQEGIKIDLGTPKWPIWVHP